MNPNVTFLNGPHHGVPFPLNVGAVGVQFDLQSFLLENLLTGNNIVRKADTYA